MHLHLVSTLVFFLAVLQGVLPSSSSSRVTQFGRRRNGQDIDSNNNVTVVFVDVGSNYTLPCSGRLMRNDGDWTWEITRDDHDKTKTQHSYVQEDGSLYFSTLQQSDSGLYSCQLESGSSGENEEESTTTSRNRISQSSAIINRNRRKYSSDRSMLETRVRLRVRTPPLPMRNVTVLPSTVLASVMWETGDDGGYPISSFQLRYRLKNESEVEWKTCQPNYISPDKRHIDVFHLLPNSTYIFEMWANNHLGKGYSTAVQVSTHNDQQEIEGKYLLESVETLDTRAWIVAVLIVLATLFILAFATCCLFYKEYYITGSLWISGEIGRSHHPHRRFDLDGESIELMPNIILNPAYEFQSMMEQQQQHQQQAGTSVQVFEQQQQQQPDENLNDKIPVRVNNNSVIHPARV